jgi:hypothetical protein
VNVPPARIGRRHIPLIKPNPFREGDTTKNTTQQPPFSPEQKISDLKKETTILDSTKDQSHQDHHLIHYTPLVQRERERFIPVRLGIEPSIPSWFVFYLIFNYCGFLR